MTTRFQSLTPDQLAWCQQRMPAFAVAYADVCRRDADVAANRAAFEGIGRQQKSEQKLSLVKNETHERKAASAHA